MRLKYLMRGLGIAMIIISFVFKALITYDKTEDVTKTEKIASEEPEKHQLTQKDNTIKSEEKNSSSPKNIANNIDEKTNKTEANQISNKEDSNKEEKEEIKKESEEKVKKPEKIVMPQPKVGEKVKFYVKSGATSESVSKSLENSGLIDNSYNFNQFLVNNGYSRSIRVGNYVFKRGDSYTEIANKLTGR